MRADKSLDVDATAPEVISAAVLGLVVGSFLNVVAYRLPRGESIVHPRSRCPKCGVQIAAYDNVPVISWIVLRGRCRHCSAGISIEYPLVELITGGLYAGVVAKEGLSVDALPGLALMTMLVLVAAIDLEHRIVPNKVLAVAAPLAVVLWAVADAAQLPENLLAAAIAGLVFGAINLIYPQGMGMGDVKLAAVMGLYLGVSVAPALAVAVVVGAIGGLAAALLAGARGQSARKYAIPFAPFMAFGGVIGEFFGPDLVDWYLGVSGFG